MSVVTVQTTVQCVLGTLDDEGNVVATSPVNLQIPALKKELFEAAYEALVKAKAEYAKTAAPAPAPAPQFEPEPEAEPKKKGAR